MPISRVTCPECGAVFLPDLDPVRYPGGSPTGNPDHTIITRDEHFNCPRCGEQLAVQVARFIETGLVCWLDGPAKVAPLEEWADHTALFSPDGQRVAVALSGVVRIFERDGEGWRQLISLAARWCDLIAWTDERWLVSTAAIWDLAEQTAVWNRSTRDIWPSIVAYDAQRRIVACGGRLLTLPERRSLRTSTEGLTVRDLASGTVAQAELGKLDTMKRHVTRWDLGRDLAFCALPVSSTKTLPRNSYENDHSVLGLWRYLPATKTVEQVAEARLPRGLIQEAWWEPDGTIVVAAWYRWIDLPPVSSIHAYGLARLDGVTLELLHEQRWVGPPPEPRARNLWFNRAAPLAGGEILWHTSRVSLLDRATWAVRETLPYVPLVPERVTFAPDGATYALGRPNDVLIVDRATERAWSLRRGRQVPLHPPAPSV